MPSNGSSVAYSHSCSGGRKKKSERPKHATGELVKRKASSSRKGRGKIFPWVEEEKRCGHRGTPLMAASSSPTSPHALFSSFVSHPSSPETEPYFASSTEIRVPAMFGQGRGITVDPFQRVMGISPLDVHQRFLVRQLLYSSCVFKKVKRNANTKDTVEWRGVGCPDPRISPSYSPPSSTALRVPPTAGISWIPAQPCLAAPGRVDYLWPYQNHLAVIPINSEFVLTSSRLGGSARATGGVLSVMTENEMPRSRRMSREAMAVDPPSARPSVGDLTVTPVSREAAMEKWETTNEKQEGGCLEGHPAPAFSSAPHVTHAMGRMRASASDSRVERQVGRLRDGIAITRIAEVPWKRRGIPPAGILPRNEAVDRPITENRRQGETELSGNDTSIPLDTASTTTEEQEAFCFRGVPFPSITGWVRDYSPFSLYHLTHTLQQWIPASQLLFPPMPPAVTELATLEDTPTPSAPLPATVASLVADGSHNPQRVSAFGKDLSSLESASPTIAPTAKAPQEKEDSQERCGDEEVVNVTPNKKESKIMLQEEAEPAKEDESIKGDSLEDVEATGRTTIKKEKDAKKNKENKTVVSEDSFLRAQYALPHRFLITDAEETHSIWAIQVRLHGNPTILPKPEMWQENNGEEEKEVTQVEETLETTGPFPGRPSDKRSQEETSCTSDPLLFSPQLSVIHPKEYFHPSSISSGTTMSPSSSHPPPTPLIGNGEQGFRDGYFKSCQLHTPIALCWRGVKVKPYERTSPNARTTEGTRPPHGTEESFRQETLSGALPSLLFFTTPTDATAEDHTTTAATSSTSFCYSPTRAAPTQLFISDAGNHAIRLADFSTQMVRTLVGSGGSLFFPLLRQPGYRDGAASQALLYAATGMVYGSSGLLFTDGPNGAIRLLTGTFPKQLCCPPEDRSTSSVALELNQENSTKEGLPLLVPQQEFVDVVHHKEDNEEREKGEVTEPEAVDSLLLALHTAVVSLSEQHAALSPPGADTEFSSPCTAEVSQEKKRKEEPAGKNARSVPSACVLSDTPANAHDHHCTNEDAAWSAVRRLHALVEKGTNDNEEVFVDPSLVHAEQQPTVEQEDSFRPPTVWTPPFKTTCSPIGTSNAALQEKEKEWLSSLRVWTVAGGGSDEMRGRSNGDGTPCIRRAIETPEEEEERQRHVSSAVLPYRDAPAPSTAHTAKFGYLTDLVAVPESSHGSVLSLYVCDASHNAIRVLTEAGKVHTLVHAMDFEEEEEEEEEEKHVMEHMEVDPLCDGASLCGSSSCCSSSSTFSPPLGTPGVLVSLPRPALSLAEDAFSKPWEKPANMFISSASTSTSLYAALHKKGNRRTPRTPLHGPIETPLHLIPLSLVRRGECSPTFPSSSHASRSSSRLTERDRIFDGKRPRAMKDYPGFAGSESSSGCRLPSPVMSTQYPAARHDTERLGEPLKNETSALAILYSTSMAFMVVNGTAPRKRKEEARTPQEVPSIHRPLGDFLSTEGSVAFLLRKGEKYKEDEEEAEKEEDCVRLGVHLCLPVPGSFVDQLQQDVIQASFKQKHEMNPTARPLLREDEPERQGGCLVSSGPSFPFSFSPSQKSRFQKRIQHVLRLGPRMAMHGVHSSPTPHGMPRYTPDGVEKALQVSGTPSRCEVYQHGTLLPSSMPRVVGEWGPSLSLVVQAQEEMEREKRRCGWGRPRLALLPPLEEEEESRTTASNLVETEGRESEGSASPLSSSRGAQKKERKQDETEKNPATVSNVVWYLEDRPHLRYWFPWVWPPLPAVPSLEPLLGTVYAHIGGESVNVPSIHAGSRSSTCRTLASLEHQKRENTPCLSPPSLLAIPACWSRRSPSNEEEEEGNGNRWTKREDSTGERMHAALPHNGCSATEGWQEEGVTSSGAAAYGLTFMAPLSSDARLGMTQSSRPVLWEGNLHTTSAWSTPGSRSKTAPRENDDEELPLIEGRQPRVSRCPSSPVSSSLQASEGMEERGGHTTADVLSSLFSVFPFSSPSRGPFTTTSRTRSGGGAEKSEAEVYSATADFLNALPLEVKLLPPPPLPSPHMFNDGAKEKEGQQWNGDPCLIVHPQTGEEAEDMGAIVNASEVLYATLEKGASEGIENEGGEKVTGGSLAGPPPLFFSFSSSSGVALAGGEVFAAHLTRSTLHDWCSTPSVATGTSFPRTFGIFPSVEACRLHVPTTLFPSLVPLLKGSSRILEGGEGLDPIPFTTPTSFSPSVPTFMQASEHQTRGLTEVPTKENRASRLTRMMARLEGVYHSFTSLPCALREKTKRSSSSPWKKPTGRGSVPGGLSVLSLWYFLYCTQYLHAPEAMGESLAGCVANVCRSAMQGNEEDEAGPIMVEEDGACHMSFTARRGERKVPSVPSGSSSSLDSFYPPGSPLLYRMDPREMIPFLYRGGVQQYGYHVIDVLGLESFAMLVVMLFLWDEKCLVWMSKEKALQKDPLSPKGERRLPSNGKATLETPSKKNKEGSASMMGFARTDGLGNEEVTVPGPLYPTHADTIPHEKKKKNTLPQLPQKKDSRQDKARVRASTPLPFFSSPEAFSFSRKPTIEQEVSSIRLEESNSSDERVTLKKRKAKKGFHCKNRQAMTVPPACSSFAEPNPSILHLLQTPRGTIGRNTTRKGSSLVMKQKKEKKTLFLSPNVAYLLCHRGIWHLFLKEIMEKEKETLQHFVYDVVTPWRMRQRNDPHLQPRNPRTTERSTCKEAGMEEGTEEARHEVEESFHWFETIVWDLEFRLRDHLVFVTSPSVLFSPSGAPASSAPIPMDISAVFSELRLPLEEVHPNTLEMGDGASYPKEKEQDRKAKCTHLPSTPRSNSFEKGEKSGAGSARSGSSSRMKALQFAEERAVHQLFHLLVLNEKPLWSLFEAFASPLTPAEMSPVASTATLATSSHCGALKQRVPPIPGFVPVPGGAVGGGRRKKELFPKSAMNGYLEQDDEDREEAYSEPKGKEGVAKVVSTHLPSFNSSHVSCLPWTLYRRLSSPAQQQREQWKWWKGISERMASICRLDGPFSFHRRSSTSTGEAEAAALSQTASLYFMSWDQFRNLWRALDLYPRLVSYRELLVIYLEAVYVPLLAPPPSKEEEVQRAQREARRRFWLTRLVAQEEEVIPLGRRGHGEGAYGSGWRYGRNVCVPLSYPKSPRDGESNAVEGKFCLSSMVEKLTSTSSHAFSSSRMRRISFIQFVESVVRVAFHLYGFPTHPTAAAGCSSFPTKSEAEEAVEGSKAAFALPPSMSATTKVEKLFQVLQVLIHYQKTAVSLSAPKKNGGTSAAARTCAASTSCRASTANRSYAAVSSLLPLSTNAEATKRAFPSSCVSNCTQGSNRDNLLHLLQHWGSGFQFTSSPSNPSS